MLGVWIVSLFLVLLFGWSIFILCRNHHSTPKELYNNNDHYDMTTIITTSPYRCMLKKNHLLQTVKSLSLVPYLTKIPIMVCFDGAELDPHHPVDPKCSHPTNPSDYETYKKQSKKAILNLFPHVQFFELPYRGCLTKNIHQCFHHVTTEYINVMQHDLYITKYFPIVSVMNVMRNHPEIKLVRYSCSMNNERHEIFTENLCKKRNFQCLPFQKEEIQREGVFFSRCHQWSDQNHITTSDYYRNIVFPETLSFSSFMEHHLMVKPAFDHDRYGTYYLGSYKDGNYCRHSDGRYSSC